MKPSERINQIIGKTSSDPEWQERAIEAIITYLDEQAEKDGKNEQYDPSRCQICVMYHAVDINGREMYPCKPKECAHEYLEYDSIEICHKCHKLKNEYPCKHIFKNDICVKCYTRGGKTATSKPKDNGEVIKELAEEIKNLSFHHINGWEIVGNCLYMAEHLIALGYRKTGGQ